jgi:hypothetical protein
LGHIDAAPTCTILIVNDLMDDQERWTFQTASRVFLVTFATTELSR